MPNWGSEFWVFDINFTPAPQQVKDRGYIDVICRTLPPSNKVTRIEQAVAAWFDKKLQISTNLDKSI